MSEKVADDDLARAAGRGDLDAFRSLVERHGARVYSMALRLVRDRTEAEDMAQEAFLRIYRGLPGFRGEAAFLTWMTRVSLNTFQRFLKRLPRREVHPVPAEDDDQVEEIGGPSSGPADNPESCAMADQEAGRMRRLVADLPSPFREAVVLFYLEDRSVKEAAGTLGVSAGTLKSRLFRGREMLLRRFRQEAVPVTRPIHGAAPVGAARVPNVEEARR
jgi:RNA polymerase sigma-70 factor (ECF subfamily)